MASLHENHTGNEGESIGSFSAYSERGKRNSQQDRYLVETVQLPDTSLQLLAVMDGHLGSEAVETTASQLVPATQEACDNIHDPGNNLVYVLAATIGSLDKATRDLPSGTTLSLVAIPEDKQRAYVAIIGDSPVIINDINNEIIISPEHNARSNPEERSQAQNRGAVYTDDGYLHPSDKAGSIQLSRTLGDKDFSQFLSRTPEIYSVELGEGSTVIVASDGVTDPSHKSSQENNAGFMATMVREGQADAESLVRGAISRGSVDNATAIVWRTGEI